MASEQAVAAEQVGAAEQERGPQMVPFEKPLPSTLAPPAPALNPDQQAKYDNLLKTVESWTTVPNSTQSNATSDPITDGERLWLTRECLLRYLRASKWDVAEAGKRLISTLTWRRDYGVEKHTADYISPEQETGKQFVLGYDNESRPCLYLCPSKQNTKQSPRQIEHLVYMIERVIDMSPPGQESMNLLINFKESSSGQHASIAQGRQTMNILQYHYPERLGRAVVTNIPWVFWGFFKIIGPFIDPTTREKLRFNEDPRLHIPPEQLSKSMDGDVNFVYDHSIYWPALNKMSAERRALMEQNWIAGGKRIGEFEDYLKGGTGPALKDLISAEPSKLSVVEKLPESEMVPEPTPAAVTA